MTIAATMIVAISGIFSANVLTPSIESVVALYSSVSAVKSALTSLCTFSP